MNHYAARQFKDRVGGHYWFAKIEKVVGIPCFHKKIRKARHESGERPKSAPRADYSEIFVDQTRLSAQVRLW